MSNDYTNEEIAGTGFIVQPPVRVGGERAAYSYLVTNLHMVEGYREGKILNSDDANFKVYGLVHADITNDIAILQVPYIPCDSLGLEPIERPSLELGVGDEIAVFGYPTYPDFIDGALSTGIVAAFVRQRNEVTGSIITQFLQVTAQVSAGSSGSPVFNRAGKVVGLITKRFRPDMNSGTDLIGIAALSGSVSKLLSDLEKWDKERGTAVVPLQYIRKGFKAEDLDAVITPEFRHFTDADQLRQIGVKHDYAKKLLEIADQSALVHFQMGLTKSDLKLPEEAIKALTRATEIDEQYAAAWFQLGRICIEQYNRLREDKKMDSTADLIALAVKACSRAQRLLDIAPSNYMLGEALLLANRTEEAAKYYEIAFQKNPDDPVILVAHFHMLGLRNRLPEARELLAKLESIKGTLSAEAQSRFEKTAKLIRSK